MHLIAQSSQIQDESDEKAMSKMIKGLRKIVVKTMSENSQPIIEGNEHVLQMLSTNMQTSDRGWFT